MTTTPPEEYVTDPLAKLEAELGDVALVIGDVVADAPTEDVLAVRGRLEDIKNTLAYAIESVDRRIIQLHPWNKTHDAEGSSIPILVPGGGTIKISGGTVPKRYDNPRLESALVEAIAGSAPYEKVVTPDGVVEDFREAAATIVRAVVNAAAADTASFASWRKTVLRQYGIDITDYALEMEKTPLKVRIEGRNKEGV